MARGTIPSILDDEELKKLAKQLEGRKPMQGSRQRFTSRGEGNAAVDLRKAIGRRKDKSFEPGGLLWRVAPGWAPGAHEKAKAKVDKEWKTIGTGNPEGIPRKVTTKGSKRRNVRLREQEQAALDAAAEKLKGIKTGTPSQIPRLSREWDQKEWLNSAEYKSLGIPMEGSRDRINQALNKSQRQIARHGGPVAREIALDLKNDVRESTAPKLPETGWSNVFTKDKDGNMVGVMTRNERLAWEKANFQQQQSLIEPGKLGQLGTNVQGGPGVGGNTVDAIEKRKPEIKDKPDITKKDIPKAEPPKIEPPKKDPPKKGIEKNPSLTDSAKNFAKSFVPNPWVLLARAVAFAANPSHDDKALPFNNRSPNIAQDFQIDDENLKYMA